MAVSTEDRIFEDWRDDVLSSMSGAAPSAVNHAIERVIREFLVRSRVWQEKLTPKVTSGRRYTSLHTGYTNVVPSVVINAAWRGTPISTRFDDLSSFSVASSSSISAVRLVPPTRLELLETPTETSTTNLEVWVSLLPEVGTLVVPELVKTHHFECILSGVMSMMYAQPDKPYTNGELAKVYRFKYLQGIGTARESVNKGYSQAETPFMFNRAFR